MSLTCRTLYCESKREMLASIWIEFGTSNVHQHSILRGAAATYQAEDILDGVFLSKESDRNLIHRVYCCIQVGDDCGTYPTGGRTIVKDIVNRLLGYRKDLTKRSFADIPLTFVGEGQGIDWPILASLTEAMENISGIRIIWELPRMLIHNGTSLYLHRIDDDDNLHASVDGLGSAPVHTLQLSPALDDRDVPITLGVLRGSLRSLAVSFTPETNTSPVAFNQAAISALGSLSALSVRIVAEFDNFPSWFLHSGPRWESPGGPLVWHLKFLIQMLQAVPPIHKLRLLSIAIEAEMVYDVNTDSFCRDFEAASGVLSNLLCEARFASIKLNVDIRLRPTRLTAGSANFLDSIDVWGGFQWDDDEWDIKYDKDGLRVPSCNFRKHREKVDASFGIMRSALQGFGDRLSWCMSSTEMSTNCELRIKHREKKDRAVKAGKGWSLG
jgi:hypothetical protein